MYPDYNMYNQFCRFNDYNYRSSGSVYIENDEIITLNQAIELIRKSVGNEKEDELFYDNLIKQAPTEKEKEIIISIRDDERKHNQILRELYYNFTGQVIPVDTMIENVDSGLSYEEQLEKALFGELDAVVKYRRIMGTMPSGSSYTLIMSVMTDELRHANKYNFLIHKAK
jgi:rubrerythrin